MTKIKELLMAAMILFDPVYNQTNKTTDTEATTGNDLTVEMKTYYSEYLIKLVGPKLVHDQSGENYPIPKNSGKNIEFRKPTPLGKQMTPLQEGVTPAGQKLNMTAINATIRQYGGFVETSDILQLTTIDNLIVLATELLSDQAGETLDTVTRDVITSGTNVSYANGKTARAALVQGTDKLTVRDIRKAVRKLKLQKAPKFGNYYAGIIHPDIEFDLMDDSEWKYPHQYVDTENVYLGELGAIAGVRFVETTEAKVYTATPLPGADASGNYTVSSYSNKVITISDELTSAQAAALVGRMINIGTAAYTVTAASAFVDGGAGADTAATITIKETPATNPSSSDKIYPGEVGSLGANVYATMIIGKRAYAKTGVAGGELQHIVKPLGSSGTADPLNQRSTVGWKAIKAVARLIEQYMVRIESTSSFETTEEN